MRRKSLLELAKRLRNSTGGGSSAGGSPKSTKSGTEDDEELDENGNIITKEKRQSKKEAAAAATTTTTIKTTPRKSLTFALGHTEVPPSPPRHQQDNYKSQFEVNKTRNRRRRSLANCNDVATSKSGVLLNTIDGDASRPTKRRQYEEEEKRRASVGEFQVTSTRGAGAAEGESSDDKKGWTKITRQLKRMTNDELESILNADDDFVLDCLIDQRPIIKRLERDRDDIRKQVSSLANFNYAREPEFVRDRLKLREITEDVARMVRHTTGKYLEPILGKLDSVQNRLAQDARDCEESSEAMANEFLASGKPYDEFINQYVCLRKETSKKRILADKLAKERDLLMSNILYKSLLLTNNNNNNYDSNNNDANCSINKNISKHVTDDDNHDEMAILTKTPESSTTSTPSTW